MTLRSKVVALSVLSFALVACRALIGYEDGVGLLGDGGSGDGNGSLQDGSTTGDCGAGLPPCITGTDPPNPFPSCVGLSSTCGATRDRDCCQSNVVPGGTFSRSNDPTFPAIVSAFRLDTYEVTVGRFRRFAAAYSPTMIPAGAGKNPNNAADPGWDSAWNAQLPQTSSDLAVSLSTGCGETLDEDATWTAFPEDRENHPINCTTWYVAQAFCIWDGGRLPTEAEWNFAAAGGSEQRLYPWGNTAPGADATLAVYNCYGGPDGGVSCGAFPIEAVGSAPAGKARWGHADMAGNVREWTVDSYVTPYRSPCLDCAVFESGSTYHVSRGGSYADATDTISTPDRIADPGTGSLSGLRCARTP